MDTLDFLTTNSVNGIIERDFTLGEVTGVLWSPTLAREPSPLVLMGHGGGLHKKAAELVSRAHKLVDGHHYHVVAIDAPGHGDRPRSAQDDQIRAALRAAYASGDRAQVMAVSSEYGRDLAERAVPEWQATLDALENLAEIGANAPIGYGGGITLGTAIGIPLAAKDSRIAAAIFGGGFVVHEALIEAAKQISVPIQFLLPWDDEYVDRQLALKLFDTFAAKEKTLHANPGDHRNIRWIGIDEDFLPRHLSGTQARSDGPLERGPSISGTT